MVKAFFWWDCCHDCYDYDIVVMTRVCAVLFSLWASVESDSRAVLTGRCWQTVRWDTCQQVIGSSVAVGWQRGASPVAHWNRSILSLIPAHLSLLSLLLLGVACDCILHFCRLIVFAHWAPWLVNRDYVFCWLVFLFTLTCCWADWYFFGFLLQ